MSSTESPIPREITEPSPLLDGSGSLLQTGWARRPLLDCNLENARTTRIRPLQRLLVKRWDYYGVTSPEGFFSVTIADLGYADMAFVYTVDFRDASYHEETVTVPFGRGVVLPRNSDHGDSRFANRHVQAEFSVEENRRLVKVHWDDFGGVPLDADLRFTVAERHESTVTVIPIRGKRFYYNRKINTMPVEGTLRVGDTTTYMDPASSFGNLDWGRGVWEYNSFWVWASASGLMDDGRTVGLNMGRPIGDVSPVLENTLLVDGRIHQLGAIDIEYSDTDFMKPWTMRSDRVDLEFTPFLERVAATTLVVVRSEVHQMFGHYAGTVVDDAGHPVRIEGLVGWAEEHHARW